MAKFQVIHSSVYSDMLGVDAPAMILGETASSGKGGCPDLSNTYIAGTSLVLHSIAPYSSVLYLFDGVGICIKYTSTPSFVKQ